MAKVNSDSKKQIKKNKKNRKIKKSTGVKISSCKFVCLSKSVFLRFYPLVQFCLLGKNLQLPNYESITEIKIKTANFVSFFFADFTICRLSNFVHNETGTVKFFFNFG